MAQLVLHFVTDPNQVAAELRRVVRPGGIVAANMWDSANEMEMLHHFWDAAFVVDQFAPTDARTLRFGGAGEIAELFDSVGLENISEVTITVSSSYQSFDEVWSGFLAGIGPAGMFCVGLADAQQLLVRQEMFKRLGSPSGQFSLNATARSVSGRTPA